ncbi:MAG: hypothetical protein CVV41_06995 [Candidatus Riflebacteria bacterium HGW-Riflebacteria-1]|jgi:hypothetical protein|nr:MAG: hypothetical protein CVV41_06995 [Candidatus Riflebacteria bacterium HGW-Riflebacteria-1]
MKCRIWAVLAILLVVAASDCVLAVNESLLQKVMAERMSDKRLSETILGALAFLEDRQVRPRPGKLSCEFDSSDEGDGCDTRMSINIPFRENIGLPAPKQIKARNRSGEWASYIHFLPNKIGFKGRSPAAVQDSNLFMTAFIAYPLFLFDESALPPEKQHVNLMLRLAMQNIQSFKREDAYNFWAVLPGSVGKSPRTGPFNILVEQLELLGRAYINPKLAKFFARLAKGQQTPPKFWLEACLDLKNNPTGADALFNIPNDADDTSTAVAIQHFFSQRFPDSGIVPDHAALVRIPEYRDIGRPREDGRDGWKGKDTGAYLTWLKDESQPVFERPEVGIIPLAVNNVDVVVNSNVLFAMALTGSKDLPGYDDCARLIRRAAETRSWPEAGLYYPQNMIFPYSASRAYRDGNAREPDVKAAMQYILRDLIKAQVEWGNKNPTRRGAFPGGDDKSDHLSTGLAVISLINIGRINAAEIGLEKEYDAALRSGIDYLLEQCIWQKPKNPDTRGKFKTPAGKCATWMSGLFFAASFWDLAHWRSQAFTISIVLEALTKYALAYDLDLAPMGARRIKLRP